MSAESIAQAFAEHGTWISRFVIGGVTYGGSFDAMSDPRLEAFFAEFPKAETILELGALEGGHTIALGQRPHVTRVLGLEGREANLLRAQTAARLLRAEKVEFVQADLESVALRDFGCFDAIFCSGLLYHLPEPWKLLRQFREVSSGAFLWTHYCKEDEADRSLGGYKGRLQVEGGMEEPLSGLSQHSFWPTLGSLLQMLSDAGFGRLHLLSNDPDQTDGPAVTLAAFAAQP